jgi:hypothetical protein
MLGWSVPGVVEVAGKTTAAMTNPTTRTITPASQTIDFLLANARAMRAPLEKGQFTTVMTVFARVHVASQTSMLGMPWLRCGTT